MGADPPQASQRLRRSTLRLSQLKLLKQGIPGSHHHRPLIRAHQLPKGWFAQEIPQGTQH